MKTINPQASDTPAPKNRNPIPKRIPKILIHVIALFFLAAAPAMVFAQGNDTRAPYILRPDSVAAGQAFDLQLLSYRFNCATLYSHQSVKIEGGKVVLSFLATERPNAICPAVAIPYGPTFTMAAMTAGHYDVYARKLAPCMVTSDSSSAVCKMAVASEFAGVLTVSPTTRRGWFLQPKQVGAEKAFTMRILSYAYGNCHTSFTREVLTLRDGAFYASFVIVQNPDHVCVTDIRPHGPSFEVKGQPIGRYPLYANAQNPCRFDAQPCMVSSSPDRWVLVDTLEVVKGDPTGVVPGRGGVIPARVFPEGTPASAGAGLVRGWRLDGRVPLESSK